MALGGKLAAGLRLAAFSAFAFGVLNCDKSDSSSGSSQFDRIGKATYDEMGGVAGSGLAGSGLSPLGGGGASGSSSSGGPGGDQPLNPGDLDLLTQALQQEAAQLKAMEEPGSDQLAALILLLAARMEQAKREEEVLDAIAQLMILNKCEKEISAQKDALQQQIKRTKNRKNRKELQVALQRAPSVTQCFLKSYLAFRPLLPRLTERVGKESLGILLQTALGGGTGGLLPQGLPLR